MLKKKRERLGHGGRRLSVFLAFEEFVLSLLEEDIPVRKSVALKGRVWILPAKTRSSCLREARGSKDLARSSTPYAR